MKRAVAAAWLLLVVMAPAHGLAGGPTNTETLLNFDFNFNPPGARAQLINTETSTVLAARDIFDPAKGPRTAQQKMRELAAMIKQDYPLVVGSVLGLSNKRLALDVGSQKRMRPEMRVLVYREGDPIVDPQTKVVLDRNIESLGEGMLNEVRPQISFAVLRSPDLGPLERVLAQKKALRVITK